MRAGTKVGKQHSKLHEQKLAIQQPLKLDYYSILMLLFQLVHVQYMKIHVPSMLAIGVDKHTQQTNKQPQWLH